MIEKMKILPILTTTIFLLTVYTNTSFGMLVGKTPEELYHESDVILIGKIITAKGDTEQRATDYTISVERYLKNDLNESKIQITSSGCKSCNPQIEDEPIFATGDRVLLYLNKVDNTYQISPYSSVLGIEDNDLLDDRLKNLENAAAYERLFPQIVASGIIGLAVISFVIVYFRRKNKK